MEAMSNGLTLMDRVSFEPGKIQAGGLIQFSLRRVINDNSQITAGDDLNFEGGSIEFNNVGAMGRQVTTDEAVTLNTPTLTSLSPFLNSGLQRLHPDPEQPYLIQTDPRFTRNSDMLSSNLLLKSLNLDPKHVPKRLGDGFYEQQLIRDQIIGLTGHYYLSGYRNPITEFKALMHRGVQPRKQALSSTFSGNTVKMEAGHDLSVMGSNIIGMRAVGLYADNDINLNAAQQIEKASHYSVKERSGLLDSGSLGFTIGERQQKDEFEGESTPHIGTVIGSVSGYIQAIAGREYHQSGSQLVAPEGNIEGKALKGTVVPVYEQGRRWQHNEWHQSGLTVSVSAPVIAAAQTGQQMLQASTQVSDPRMHVLAAGAGALAAKNAYDAIQTDPKAAGGVTVSAMIGESHQEFQQTQLSTTALGSAIKAGGTVRLDMKGLGEASILSVIGSQIEAKQDVELNIEGPLNVEAAPNTFSQHSTRHNQSSAVGMAATFGTQNSVGASVAISRGRGHTDGVEVSHTPAQIKAGRTLMLNAQSDVHLKGAQLSGQQVEARIVGDLEIESVQNTNSYNSHYHSISGSATAGPTSAISVNFSQQKIDSTYRSVAEQAGIQANDGGFQIKVKGDTKLVGGVIASTDQAIAEG
ncbi:hypothetical protein CPC16_007753 [Podila verticillata]|nr:hypothetical protein CPC16_007753 [Podila verticillata]